MFEISVFEILRYQCLRYQCLRYQCLGYQELTVYYIYSKDESTFFKASYFTYTSEPSCSKHPYSLTSSLRGQLFHCNRLRQYFC